MFELLAQATPVVPATPAWDYWESRGTVAVVLAVLCLAIWRIGAALWVRLFDDDKGYATRIVNRHVTFMDKATEATESTAELSERVTNAVESLAANEADCRIRHAKTMSALGKIAAGHHTEAEKEEARRLYAEAQSHLSIS